MNPWTWLENHPNAALVAVIGGSIALLSFAGWIIHWYVVAARYWLAWLRRPAPVFDDEWQREPETDADFEQMRAEWHDETSPAWDVIDHEASATLHSDRERRKIVDSARAGELHLEPWLERGWWDDPDLVVWDAKRQADRCWEILHVEFPRLRAELCGVS